MPDFNTFLPTEKQLKTPYLTNVRDSSGHNFLAPYNKNMVKKDFMQKLARHYTESEFEKSHRLGLNADHECAKDDACKPEDEVPVVKEKKKVKKHSKTRSRSKAKDNNKNDEDNKV